MRVLGSFGAHVHRDDDDVGGVAQECDGFLRLLRVEYGERSAADGERCETVANAVKFEQLVFAALLETSIGELCLVEGSLRADPAFVAEVARMVVRDAHVVESRVEQVACVVLGRAEAVAVGGFLGSTAAGLGEAALVHEHAFEVSRGEVGVPQDFLYFGEHELAVLLGENGLVFGKVEAHHDVANTDDGKRFGFGKSCHCAHRKADSCGFE